MVVIEASNKHKNEKYGKIWTNLEKYRKIENI